MRTDSISASKTQKTTAQKIWALLTAAEKRSAVFLMIFMFIGMVLETLGIGLVIPTIAAMTQDDLGESYPFLQPFLAFAGNPGQQMIIMGGMLVLVGIYLIKTIFLTFLAWRQASFSFGVLMRLSRDIFSLYLHQPYTFHLQRNSAHLIRNIVTEVNQFIFNGINPGLILLTEGLVLLGIVSLLFAVEPVGAFIVVTVLGLTGLGFYRFTRQRITSWGEARQYHEGFRIQHLQQGLGGVKDAKLLGLENNFIDQYHYHNIRSARAGKLRAVVQQLPRLWLEFIAVTGLAVLVLVLLVQGSEFSTIVPTLALFAAAAFRLLPSFSRILSAVQSLRFGLAVINTLHKEVELTNTDNMNECESIIQFQRMIGLRQVSFTYPDAPAPAVNDLSLTIQRGESVGIIGTSGAGKSTLVDIILGLLKPDQGCITVDGIDIRNNIMSWQGQIGYVPQSIYLTDDTLRRNVAFGLLDNEIDEAEVIRAINAAQLQDFVTSLPHGLETIVGERGIRLSGGQRQRIGIARALYNDPAVLVLDEATSSLDISTESHVMEAVTALQGDKTIIIVAHRLSTVAHCDRIYRIDHGTVVDEGSPEAMLNAENI